MAKKVYHFKLNALVEPIRYILHYTKQEFEDGVHELSSWSTHEMKDGHPFGQLPLYEEGERALTHALVAAKYVAQGTDLIPLDPWLQAVLESAAYIIYEYWSQVYAYVIEKDPKKKEEMKHKLIEETIDDIFARLEKQLNENGGYFSGKLSWVEFVLCGIVEASNTHLGIELEKKYPAIEAVVKKIKNLPGVKEYIAARGPYVADK